ncbi:MAG: hypothetical protein ACR2M4_08445 [Actinomycetota bacterium]
MSLRAEKGLRANEPSRHYRDAVAGSVGGFLLGLGLALFVVLTDDTTCDTEEVGTGLACIHQGLGVLFGMLTLIVVLPWAGATIGCATMLRWKGHGSAAATIFWLAALSVLSWPILFFGGWNFLVGMTDNQWPLSISFPFLGAIALVTGITLLLRRVAANSTV